MALSVVASCPLPTWRVSYLTVADCASTLCRLHSGVDDWLAPPYVDVSGPEIAASLRQGCFVASSQVISVSYQCFTQLYEKA